MKKIDIPLKLQKEGSMDCGPVCVQMVLGYFGITKDIESLVEKLKYAESGTSAYDNGALLLDSGLKVTAITAQPRLFPPEVISSVSSKEDLLNVIESRKQQVRNQKDKDNLGTFEKFLNKGGSIKLEIPNFNHIKSAIDSNQPVVALLFGQALGKNEGGFHFVVVSGYDENNIYINNPSSISSKNGCFPIDRFLYALHSSTTIEFDNGTLLIVSK
ncbi:MAG: peptidase C39 family protein [Candidatus Pacebacteria bacterium]|nr:peptidase C39 family protein [Candidatus Paceibacterota bacterium]